MDSHDIMNELENMCTEQTKRTFMRHGAVEPILGVKIGDLKKLTKYVKKDHQLALDLYATGVSDAMYLAGMAIDPKKMSKEDIQEWVHKAPWGMISECTVGSVAAMSEYAMELANDWIQSENELVCCAGWSTYIHFLSITPDEDINRKEVLHHLDFIVKNIHKVSHRVRYNMNNFVIASGTFVAPLYNDALFAAEKIGKLDIDMRDTSCKVPYAPDYLEKVALMERVGKKKKSCRC